LQDKFIEKYKNELPDNKLTIINLYDLDIPRIESDGLLAIWNKQQSDITLNPTEAVIAKQSVA
jgi:FMN-dependent NADH-azoreductase